MRPEILAPAGSMDALKAAVHAGADAVYLGGDKFGARAYASNFDNTTLIDAIEYCHLYGVKVYLTINTLFRNEEIMELKDYLTPFYKAGLDAVIVQDFGVMQYVHSIFPDLAIHASTQMTITTHYAYELIRNYGVTRIVPARELTLEEIASLKKADTTPEIEVFVQGALCYCYSGQCLMSSMLGGRSGNRGRCAQTCRLPYSLHDVADKQLKTKGEYLLSPKDLCGLEAIPDLINAGVDSFKIEGRMKRPEYVAVCVRAYRKLVDAWYEGSFSNELVQQYKNEMMEVFNRGGFTNGYYNQKNGKQMMSTLYPGNVGVSIGYITSIQKNRISIQLEKDVYKGDILVPEDVNDTITLTNNIDGRKGKQIILNAPKAHQLKKGQSIRRISKSLLMDELQSYITTESPVLLKGSLQLITGKAAEFFLEVSLKGENYSCRLLGDKVEVATNKPITEDMVRDKVEQTGNTRYSFEELVITISENAFYSLKALKELRRHALAKLEQTILNHSRRNLDRQVLEVSVNLEETINTATKNTIMVSSEAQYEIAKSYEYFDCIYLDIQYFDKDSLQSILKQEHRQMLAVVLPPIIRVRYQQEIESFIAFIQKNCKNVAIMVRNIDELSMLKHNGFAGQVIADYSLYTMNKWAADFVRNVYPKAKLTVPVELNEAQIKKLQFISDNCEIMVYGYQQLMVSAQCLQATADKCNCSNSKFVMKDRYFKNFFIFSVCKYCYNLIYNGIPTVLYDLVDKTFKDKISKRFHFTKESEDEMRAVLRAVTQGEIPNGEKTRGHYRRGVE